MPKAYAVSEPGWVDETALSARAMLPIPVFGRPPLNPSVTLLVECAASGVVVRVSNTRAGRVSGWKVPGAVFDAMPPT